MPESYGQPYIGPGGEFLDLSPETKRKGVRMFKANAEAIGAETLFRALEEAVPMPSQADTTAAAQAEIDN